RLPTSSRSTSGSISTPATAASRAVPRSNASCGVRKTRPRPGFLCAWYRCSGLCGQARPSDRHMQPHVDVVAGGVGVRADLVRLFHQIFGIRLGQPWQVDVQVDVEAETTWDLADADLGGDRAVCRQWLLLLAGDEFQCADEAGRVAGGEHLLGVGAFTA